MSIHTLRRLSADDLKQEAKYTTDLRDIWLESVTKADFEGFEFKKGTCFNGSYFKNVIFQDVMMKEVQFKNCGLERVVFNGLEAPNANFDNCSMKYCQIKDFSELINSSFYSLNQGLERTYPNLIVRSDLRGALFENAKLEEFVFDNTILAEAVFEHAKMRMAKLYNCQIQSSDFTNAHNVTLQQLKDIDITPMQDDKYIGGISQANALLLFNLALTEAEFDELKTHNHVSLDEDCIFMSWVNRAMARYAPNLGVIQRLPYDQITNERRLMRSVLENDLKVKGLDTLDALG